MGDATTGSMGNPGVHGASAPTRAAPRHDEGPHSYGGGDFDAMTPRERLGARAVWAILFALPTAVFITAAFLTPSTSGHGTHTQLGLPPCGFLVFTGYPCPGCGLTTAFAHMVRLEVGGAWDANPFGVVLFSAVAMFIPLAAVAFVRGWSVIDTLDRFHAEKVAIGLSLISISVWTVRVVTQYFGA